MSGQTRRDNHLALVQEGIAAPSSTPLVWLDLFNPTPEEVRYVESLLGISLPTLEEMQEIEVSARLYQENGAEFMTLTAITQLDSEDPVTTPKTFVLKAAPC